MSAIRARYPATACPARTRSSGAAVAVPGAPASPDRTAGTRRHRAPKQEGRRWAAGPRCSAFPSSISSSVVELRQYTLHPGKRDVLIDLFDRELVESQEAVGMKVIGQFRDIDDQDRFVWLRGFRDMASRAEGLKAFYGGPVWQEHREAKKARTISRPCQFEKRSMHSSGSLGSRIQRPNSAEVRVRRPSGCPSLMFPVSRGRRSGSGSPPPHA